MKCCEFIAGLGGAAAWPLAARAQLPTMPVVGFIGGGGGTRNPFNAAFLQGLAETGYFEGRNVAIECRWVESHNERLPGFVNDLVSRRVAAMAVVDSTAAALVAKAATNPSRLFSGSEAIRLQLALSQVSPGPAAMSRA